MYLIQDEKDIKGKVIAKAGTKVEKISDYNSVWIVKAESVKEPFSVHVTNLSDKK